MMDQGRHQARSATEDLFLGRNPVRSVLLVNPPDPVGTSCNRDCNGGFGMAFAKQAKPNYPPMDFLYSATCLNRLEARAEVLDSLGRPVDISELNPGRFDLVAVRTSYPNFLNDLDFVAALLGAAPETEIYLFGPYLSAISRRDRERAMPLCGLILGEAEVPLIDLVCGRAPEEIPGVVPSPMAAGVGPGTDEARKERRADAEPFFLDQLDLLPYPDWSLFPLDGYSLESMTGRAEPIYSVLTSRGCYYRCHYCAYPLGHGRKLRFRSVENVAGELDELMTRYQAAQVVFRDPLFSAKPERVRRLLSVIRDLERKHGRRLKWIAETRPDHLDEDLLREMAHSGCMEINLGLETASEEVSRKNGRPFTPPARIGEIVGNCRELGIHVFLFFLVGLPGDTEESFLRTVEAIKGINPHFFKCFSVVPYPGTRVASWAGERGYLREHEAEHCQIGRVCSLRTEGLVQEKIAELERRAFRELCEAKALWLLENRQRATLPELLRDLTAHVANLEQQDRWDEIPHFITPLIESREAPAAGLHMRRGVAYSQMGEDENALRDFQEEVRISGEGKAVLLHQLSLLERLGRRQEAEAVLRKLTGMASSPEEARGFRLTAVRSFAARQRRSGAESSVSPDRSR